MTNQEYLKYVPIEPMDKIDKLKVDAHRHWLEMLDRMGRAYRWVTPSPEKKGK